MYGGYVGVDNFKEYEVDKTLGIKGPMDVEAMGIDKYNAQCRSIVMRYAKEWEVSLQISPFFIPYYSLVAAGEC